MQGGDFMKDYEINKETIAVIGIDDFHSKVLEKDNDYIIKHSSYEVMDNSCEYFGSNYIGRMKGSKNILNAKYKVPIIVEESNNIIFFPLSDVDNNKCIWLSLNWFDKVEQDINKKNSIIYFKNGKKLHTNISKYSIENQVMRSSKLFMILNYRKNR